MAILVTASAITALLAWLGWTVTRPDEPGRGSG